MPSSSCLSVNAPHTQTRSKFLSASVCPGLHSAEHIAVTKVYVFPFYVAANSFWDLRVSTASATLAARVLLFAILLLLNVGEVAYTHTKFIITLKLRVAWTPIDRMVFTKS